MVPSPPAAATHGLCRAGLDNDSQAAAVQKINKRRQCIGDVGRLVFADQGDLAEFLGHGGIKP
jgi:hypothetical protein